MSLREARAMLNSVIEDYEDAIIHESWESFIELVDAIEEKGMIEPGTAKIIKAETIKHLMETDFETN